MELNKEAIYWAKTKEEAIIPTKNDENAGYDIYACIPNNKVCMIKPLQTVLVPTGIAAAVSDDYYLQVQERGSTGKLGMKYSAGVIDSSYRGEIFIAITNVSDKSIFIGNDDVLKKADNDSKSTKYPINKAIAQLVLHNVPKLKSKEITYDELKNIPSKRGTGKLGSSGK